MSKAKILIIYTGGTIGSVKDPETGQLSPFDFDHLTNQVPELKNFGLQLDSIAFEELLDSSNVTPEVWVRLATLVGDNYDKHDGFVILHGTDTMAYTASALSFMLEGLNKPVILTGSQLPIGVIRTDGKENLITAIEIAGASKNGNPVVPEVAIYFEYQLFRGNRTTKHNSEDFEAFQSPNYPVLAVAGVHITYNDWAIHEPHNEPLNVQTQLDTQVALLKLHPGISESVARAVLGAEGIRLVVLETFGSGSAPTSPWLLKALQEAIDKGVIILNITQCMRGAVEQGRYTTSASLAEIGVIGGSDMTTEAAIVKSMFLLGQGLEGDELSNNLQSPLRGEMS